jgi:hypothetical protein
MGRHTNRRDVKPPVVLWNQHGARFLLVALVTEIRSGRHHALAELEDDHGCVVWVSASSVGSKFKERDDA